MRKVWVLGRPAAAGFCFFRRAPRASPTRAQRSRTHTRALARCPEGMWRGERAKSPAPPPHPLSESQNIMTSAATSPCRRSPTARRQTAARSAYDTCSDAPCSRARSSRIGRATCTGWCACRRCLAGGENGGGAPRPRRRVRHGGRRRRARRQARDRPVQGRARTLVRRRAVGGRERRRRRQQAARR